MSIKVALEHFDEHMASYDKATLPVVRTGGMSTAMRCATNDERGASFTTSNTCFPPTNFCRSWPASGRKRRVTKSIGALSVWRHLERAGLSHDIRRSTADALVVKDP
jgi:hypothetical protein